jgi:YD repeat-containing protein
VTTATDPLGNITSYTYDQLGDAATVTAPDTGVTHYTYDTNGDQLSATGPTGAVTQATYDYRGRTLTATQVERYPSVHGLPRITLCETRIFRPGQDTGVKRPPRPGGGAAGVSVRPRFRGRLGQRRMMRPVPGRASPIRAAGT